MSFSEVTKTSNFMANYVTKLKSTIREAAGGDDETPLLGMKICVNPGNGAGGFFAAQARRPPSVAPL